MRSSVRIIRAKENQVGDRELFGPFVREHSNTVGSTPSDSGDFSKNSLTTPEATPAVSSYANR